MSNSKNNHNTIGLIGLIFSITGLLLLISIVGFCLGIIFIILGLIFGIIGLFLKPKIYAIISIIISLLATIGLSILCYFGYNGAKPYIEQINSINNSEYTDIINSDDFQKKLNNEIETELQSNIYSVYEVSTGDNIIEKRSSAFFSIILKSFNNTLNIYLTENNNYNLEESETIEEINNQDDLSNEIDEKSNDYSSELSEETENDSENIQNNNTISENDKNELETQKDIVDAIE